VLKISKRQFTERVGRESELRAILDEGLALGRMSIRRQQFKLLADGNVTMAIWLGKQYLGQRDQASLIHATPDGKSPFDTMCEYVRKAPETGV